MDGKLLNKLRWLSKNIDFLLEDYNLEKEGIKVDLYFDAFDVIEAVCGMSYYYDGVFFKVEKGFGAEEERSMQDRVLVLCLAFSGKLGEIKMLIPHQAEFLSHLNKNFFIPDIYGSPGN